MCRTPSVFFLRAWCPLKLTTRLEIFYSHIKKKKKKKNRLKIAEAERTWTTNSHYWQLSAHGQNLELNVRFAHFATATAKFEKSRARPGNEWLLTTIRLSLTLDLSNLISWNRLSRENAPTRPETVTTCPALPTYNQHSHQKICYLSCLALYLKKWQNRHTNTFIPRFSLITPGCKKPTLGRVSRDASVIRAWHYLHTLTLRIIFIEIDWRCLVIIAIKIYFNCNYIF